MVTGEKRFDAADEVRGFHGRRREGAGRPPGSGDAGTWEEPLGYSTVAPRERR